MSFVLSSFIRTCKILIMSVCCSFLFLFLRFFQENRMLVVHVLILLLFLVCIGVDAYRFASHFSEKKDMFLGLFLPTGICFCLSILGYFCFTETIYNFLFIPLRTFEEFGFFNLHSILMVDVSWIVAVCLMSWIGSIHPVASDGNYFDN